VALGATDLPEDRGTVRSRLLGAAGGRLQRSNVGGDGPDELAVVLRIQAEPGAGRAGWWDHQVPRGGGIGDPELGSKRLADEFIQPRCLGFPAKATDALESVLVGNAMRLAADASAALLTRGLGQNGCVRNLIDQA
jgi:hypothetical protein